jgi:hypothetical protein
MEIMARKGTNVGAYFVTLTALCWKTFGGKKSYGKKDTCDKDTCDKDMCDKDDEGTKS